MCEERCEQCGREATEYVDGQTLCYACAEEYDDWRMRQEDGHE